MLGEQDKGSRQKTMTVMGAGLEAVDTILNLSQTNNNSGADMTIEDINKYWQDNHAEMKIISTQQSDRLLQLLNEFRREYDLVEVEDDEDLESSTSSSAVPLHEEEVNAVDSVQIVEEVDRSLFGMDAVDIPTVKVSDEEAQVRQNTIDSW